MTDRHKIPPAQPTRREALLDRLAATPRWDVAVIGGGATGLGVALDAASRGLSVVLVEAHDFAKGTSSRATKLVHGGVRYLAQGNVSLVREALRERSLLLANAPHLARPLPFVMPSYRLWETPFYGAGLVMYDALAGRAGLGSTRFLGRADVQALLPNVQPAGLRGGVLYWDGQFDDARLAVALARTAARHGALLVNHCGVTGLLHEGGRVAGFTCRDSETQRMFNVSARCVINAAGVWVDEVRALDAQGLGQRVEPMVAPSQGVHLVVDREFLPTDHALLVPRTRDGRVLFAVPWLGKVVLGTTDTPRHDLALEPRPFEEEVTFILTEAARHLARAPTRADVRSTWVGLRPLVKPPKDDGENTRKISREHTIVVSPGSLVTVTGGKWTTYRAMAEDVIERCHDAGLLPAGARMPATGHLPLVGGEHVIPDHPGLAAAPGWHGYGTEATQVQALAGGDTWLAEGLSEAMVRFSIRCEYARTVEDVLARRSRLLFLDAAAAARAAPFVASLLRQELGDSHDARLGEFEVLAETYGRVLPS